MSKIWWILTAWLALACVPVFAQEPDDEAFGDDTQQELRENPEIDNSANAAQAALQQPHADEYRHYPFLKLSANHIKLNGADWSDLAGRFRASDDTVISIVHIGDSHIQAEGSTSRTRSLLQEQYGGAGRGLIIPFRMAGTNEALDYKITSSVEFESAKMMRHPWQLPMGFTGVSIQPKKKAFDITLAVSERPGSAPDFDFVRMFSHGKQPRLVYATAEDGKRALFSDFSNGDTLTIFFFEPVTEVTMNFESEGACQIFGFQLENQMTGVEYSAIGNNGATYSSYNEIGTLGRDLMALSPNLIIISLGANEAFGQITDTQFYNDIDRLVKDIRQHNPQARILLTTPSECQRGVSRRTGKKKRRTRVYSVNENVPRLRDVILRYGRDNHVATYDWYDVAGGQGSSDKWLKEKLMNTDRIHNTWSGYALQGSLLYDALRHAIDTIE